jgi:hypothetical protein
MTEEQHDYAPERDDEVQSVLAPQFVQPVFSLGGGPAQFDAASYADGRGQVAAQFAQGVTAARQTLADAPQASQDAPEPVPTPQVPAETPPAPPAAAQGPQPLISGSFAVFVTPDQAIVLAYRPEGAADDKHLVVPPFIMNLVAQQTGHQAADVIKALGDAA